MTTDKCIIERVLKGDSQAFRELAAIYQSPVFTLAYRIIGRRDDAEDAAQETLLKAYSNLKSCRDRNKFWPWLRRITVNTCLARTNRELATDNINELVDAANTLYDPVLAVIIRQTENKEIHSALKLLPDTYRIVVILRYEEDLSYKEIAELLNEPVTSVQVRLHRAKKMLAERLAVKINELR